MDVDGASLRRVLDDPDALHDLVQPIIDLARGSIVGFEMLSRFHGPPDATPDRWFAAADRDGLGGELAARSLVQGLRRLTELPPNTFLSVNLEPQHLGSEPVRRVLAEAGRLDRLVVELTEHVAIDDPVRARNELSALREQGARTAVDDAGTGYAGLAMLLTLRPDLIKLDRSLVEAIDGDPAKRVLVRALGELADSIDAWVLAEGLETTGELEELVDLGVPLGQGYLLGRPAATFTEQIPLSIVRTIHDRLARRDYDTLAVSLQRRVLTVGRTCEPSRGSLQVVVDDLDRPLAVDPGDGSRRVDPLLAKPSEPIAEVARRAAARAPDRFAEPVVLTDGRGRVVGVLTLDRVLEHLGRRQVTEAREPGIR